MFFRRHPIKPLTFEERIESLRRGGCAVEPRGADSVEVQRQDCAAIIERSPEGLPAIIRIGVLVDGEIAALVDGGYQKFLETASGSRRPARASLLTALHSFEEDLHEALGITSLYNESLGTVFDRHSYDRLQGRPQG
jgi:hypothetical protein